MARQTGGTRRVGTIGNICFYKMRGKYFLRTKSSLTAKRVLTQRNFALTRLNAEYLSQASKIGSKVYNLFYQYEREHGMYRSFTGEAIMLLKQGRKATEAENMMIEKYTRELQLEREDALTQTSNDNKQTIRKKKLIRNKNRQVKTTCVTRLIQASNVREIVVENGRVKLRPVGYVKKAADAISRDGHGFT